MLRESAASIEKGAERQLPRVIAILDSSRELAGFLAGNDYLLRLCSMEDILRGGRAGFMRLVQYRLWHAVRDLSAEDCKGNAKRNAAEFEN